MKKKHNNWDKVKLARHPDRPHSIDYIKNILKEFQELHGDRCFGDDESIIIGTGFLIDIPVAIIAQEKGYSIKDKIKRNFGLSQPEGYRKAKRLILLAEKFKLPIISFVDTPGAFPGISSEQRHIALAIADNIQCMMNAAIPIISIIIGEGGSGGALGINISDRTFMMENSYFSVISPEGCAAILWKDKKYANKAAEALKISANDLLKFKIIDEIIEEPYGPANIKSCQYMNVLKNKIHTTLNNLLTISISKLLKNRYNKYRSFGNFIIL